nr:MAG TPA: hypothetical protein [Caudoviricetes sp.]
MASILAGYLLCKKIKICTLVVIYFLLFGKNGLRLVWQKWSKNGLKIYS